MKKILVILLFSSILCSEKLMAQAQLPDNSFEMTNNSPWKALTSKVFFADVINFSTVPYHAEDGTNFILMATDTINLKGGGYKVVPGLMTLNAAYHDRPKYLKFYYSFMGNGSAKDSFGVDFKFTRHDPQHPGKPILVARNNVIKGFNRYPWARYNEAIKYFDAGMPDSVSVIITSGAKTDSTSKATISWGTLFLFDNIVLQNDDPNTGIDEELALDNSVSVYPNPFSQSAVIHYSLEKNSYIKLVIQDITGKQVAVLQDGYETAGLHDAIFVASTLKPGLYFYRLQAGDSFSSGKLIKSE